MSNRTKYHNNNKITDYKYHKRRYKKFKKNNTPYYNKKPKNNKLITVLFDFVCTQVKICERVILGQRLRQTGSPITANQVVPQT